MSSLITRQAAFSSVNCALNEKPSPVKKSMERLRSRTGRLTKILVDMPLLESVGSPVRTVAGPETHRQVGVSCAGPFPPVLEYHRRYRPEQSEGSSAPDR